MACLMELDGQLLADRVLLAAEVVAHMKMLLGSNAPVVAVPTGASSLGGAWKRGQRHTHARLRTLKGRSVRGEAA